MKVSLNWLKKYVDLPAELTIEQLSYDLTMRTVEVEDVENTKDIYNNIVVGEIKEVKEHPNADVLKICITDIGEENPVQIVCGGSNLYVGEKVVVSKPGSYVVWHGEGEPVKIKETKMRGEASYGMICAGSEVFLDEFFPAKDETQIVDLADISCEAGQNIAEAIGMDDKILEIDNKSMTNRPDLWGHYGIARELSAIYDLPLKKLPELDIDPNLPEFPVEIKNTEKCRRFSGLVIENVDTRPAPLWMQTAVKRAGMRPINAIVDITNYSMMATGQPCHAYDKTHVKGEFVVRNAKPGEKLILLDENELDLTTDDLVIADLESPLGLAGVKGGIKDSILNDTTSVILEVASFEPQTIRKTVRRYDARTDASNRYEKNIDTQRVDQCMALALTLFREIFPDMEVSKVIEDYPVKTEQQDIYVSNKFLEDRLGRKLSAKEVENRLARLGFEIRQKDEGYSVLAPVWRSTGDIAIRDDVLEEVARMIGYENFESKPLTVNFEHAVRQPKVDIDRTVREYLSFRCDFQEVFTYPWIDEKFITAAGIDPLEAVRLATPPAPELTALRASLVPGLLEATLNNLRYFDTFKIFEVAQIFKKGETHPSTPEETLPIQKKHLAGALVGQDPTELFFEAKGVLGSLARFCQVEPLKFDIGEKPSWADEKAYQNITYNKEIIGSLGLVSAQTMNNSGIKRASMAVFEFDMEELEPYPSRTNKFQALPMFPLVEQDLSLLVDEDVKWESIEDAVSKMVKDVEFTEVYRGKQIPEGKKSIVMRVRFGSDKGTMNAKQIDKKMKGIIKNLEKKCNAVVRDE